jgi:hemolysin III
MLALYLASTLYHAIPHERAKQVLRFVDHSAIYLLIAGTYTPFALGALRGPWGWAMLGLVWSLAALGITAKIVFGMRFPRLSTWLYLGMGWIVLIAIEPMWRNVPGWGLFWLAAGGLAYTFGVIFYATDHRVRYHHFVWHLWVLTGTACHYFAVLWYAA